MTKEREVLRLALEELINIYYDEESNPRQQFAIMNAIKEVLAQPSDSVEQEPEAWMYTSQWKGNERFITRYQTELKTYKADEVWPLYTSPPQRQPLTDGEINGIAKNYALNNPTTPLHFARAIEAAHGIKEKNHD